MRSICACQFDTDIGIRAFGLIGFVQNCTGYLIFNIVYEMSHDKSILKMTDFRMAIDVP